LLTFVSYTDRKAILAYFQERFGIPEEAFDGFRLLKKGRTIWAVKDGPNLDQLLNLLKVDAAGVPLIRIRTTMQKPTTAGLRLWQATRYVIDLDDEALEEFLNRGVLLKTFPAESGYVVVRWRGEVLGCGLYSKGKLRSQIPKHWWLQVKGKIDVPVP
jgi:hypothetical protein